MRLWQKVCFPSSGLVQNSVDSGHYGWTVCRQMELTTSWAKLQDTERIDRRIYNKVAYAQGQLSIGGENAAWRRFKKHRLRRRCGSEAPALTIGSTGRRSVAEISGPTGTRASTLGDSRSQIGRLHPRPTHSRQQPSQILVLHCSTSGVEVTLQRPFPNAQRVTLDPDSRSSASMVL